MEVHVIQVEIDCWFSICINLSSNNGSDLLVTTMSENIYVIDSLEGNLRYTLTDFENPSRLPLMSDFTPDGNHIISGT